MSNGNPNRKWHGSGSFGSNLVLTVAGNGLMAFLNLATGTLAARLLHPSGRGQLAAIQVFPSFVATLAMLGLWEAVVYVSSAQPSKAGRALGSAVLITLAACPIFAAAAYLTIPWVLSAQAHHVVTAARWYLLLIPLCSLSFMPLQALRACKSLVSWNVMRVLPSIGWLVILVAAWRTNNTTPEWTSAGYLICLAVLIVPTWVIARRRIGQSIGADKKLAGEMLRYGLPSSAGTIPQNLNLRLDQMLMSAMIPPQLLGLYVVAVAWSSAINPITSAIAQPLLPRIASRESRSERVAALAQVLRVAVMISVGLAICVCAATPFLLPRLFGADFGSAVPCGMVLVIAAAFSGINYVLQEGMRGLADTPAVFFSETTGLASTALLLLLLLPRIGIMGAALASLFGYATTTSFLLIRLRRKTDTPISRFVVVDRNDISLVRRRMMAASSNPGPVSAGTIS